MQNNKNSIFSLLALISLSLMFFLPFTVAYHKWPEPNFYNQTLAILFGVLSLFVFFKPSTNKLAFPKTALVPAGLSLLLVVQWFSGIGHYWQETLLGVLYLWWSVLAMLVVARLKDIYGLESLVNWLAYALLIGGLFNVLVVFMQLIDADHFFWTFPLINKSYTGNLAQVNHLTDYLSISIISLLYLHLKGKFSTKYVVVLLMLFLLALNLTGSRMSWLYVLMIAASYYLFGRNNRQAVWKRQSKLIFLLPLSYAVVQFAFPLIVDVFSQGSVPLPPVPAERVVTLAAGESTRLSLIKEGLDIFSDNPLLGVGWGQYVWYDLMYADVHTSHKGFISHTHNLFVQVLAECGIFAGLILIIGCVYWVWQLFKQHNTPERWWLMLVAGIIFTHSMLEYPLWYAHFLGVFVVVVALADERVEINLLKPVVPSAIAAIIFVFSLHLVITTTQQYKKIEYWIAVYPQLKKEQRFTMLNELTKVYKETLIAEPLHMVLTRAYSVLPRAQAPLKVKIAKYESVMRYVQADQDIYRYILLLAADGQTDRAIQFLKRAYTRQPAYAQEFEKQLEKHTRSGNPSVIALRNALQDLQNKTND